MSFAKNEIQMASKETLDFKLRAWGTLDAHINRIADTSKPLYLEYVRRSVEAKKQLGLAKILLERKDSAALTSVYDRIDQEYEKCIDIRARIFTEYIAAKAKVPRGLPIQKALEMVESDPVAETTIGRNALIWIREITESLTVRPEDLTPSSKELAKSNFEFRNGLLCTNFTQIQERKEKLKRVRTANDAGNGKEKISGLNELIATEEGLLNLLEELDPVGTQRRDLVAMARAIKERKGTFDFTPMRQMAVAATGLVTVIGLGFSIGRTLIKKEKFEIDLATMGWGTGLAALTIRGFFDSKAGAATESLRNAGRMWTENLAVAQRIGIGKDAAEIFDSLQAAGKTSGGRALRKLDEISMAQLSTVTTDPKTLKVFEEKLESGALRAKAFRVLTEPLGARGAEILHTLIETGRLVMS